MRTISAIFTTVGIFMRVVGNALRIEKNQRQKSHRSNCDCVTNEQHAIKYQVFSDEDSTTSPAINEMANGFRFLFKCLRCDRKKFVLYEFCDSCNVIKAYSYRRGQFFDPNLDCVNIEERNVLQHFTNVAFFLSQKETNEETTVFQRFYEHFHMLINQH